MAKFFQQEEIRPDDSIERLEEELTECVDIVAEGFRERMAVEAKRHKDVTDANYYFTVVFSNRDQMNEFLTQYGFEAFSHFISGKELAEKIGKAASAPDTEFPRVKAFDRDYTALSERLKGR